MNGYKGKEFFSRSQLVFVVETALVAALDRIESGLPDCITWDDRKDQLNRPDNDPLALSAYERGGLETAGMTLAVLYANLVDDGLGIGDALHLADKYDMACQRLVREAWKDGGRKIKERCRWLSAQAGATYTTAMLYEGIYPNTHKHAEEFVDAVFNKYLAHESRTKDLFEACVCLLSDANYNADDDEEVVSCYCSSTDDQIILCAPCRARVALVRTMFPSARLNQNWLAEGPFAILVDDDIEEYTVTVASGDTTSEAWQDAVRWVRNMSKSTRQLFALVSSQGTACAETCLCAEHFIPPHQNRVHTDIGEITLGDTDKPIPGKWHDCTYNDAMACTVCGYKRN